MLHHVTKLRWRGLDVNEAHMEQLSGMNASDRMRMEQSSPFPLMKEDDDGETNEGTRTIREDARGRTGERKEFLESFSSVRYLVTRAFSSAADSSPGIHSKLRGWLYSKE